MGELGSIFFRCKSIGFLFIFALSLVFTNFVLPSNSANAQLPQCSCGNSGNSTCADGFRVTFVEQQGNTFIYDVCNEDNIPNSDCQPTMDLSHADIIISNPGCIPNPQQNISTVIVGTDNVSTRACDPPTDKDPSCDVDNLSELLIKCDDTDGIYEPGPGQCVQIQITILNSPMVGIGPTVALNKAGPVCGSGCLLGPSCNTCGPPPDEPGCCIIDSTLGICEPNTFAQDCTGTFDPDNPACDIPECEPPTGCCVITEGDCVSGTTQDQCDGENWIIGEDCDMVGICGDPEGCCQDTTSCSMTTENDCATEWTEGAPCIGVTCGEPIGCCEQIQGGDMCQDGITESACITQQGLFSPGLDCNVQGGCGPLPEPGCCQQNADTCSETLFENCDGEFFDNGGCISGGTRCSPIPTGCCQEDVQMCSTGTFAQCEGEWFEGGSCLDGDTRCSNIPLGCCVVENEKSKFRYSCNETVQVLCSEEGGVFVAEELCENVTPCGEGPITNIPTLSQWGLIMMAGIIGIISLYILIRRKELTLG